MPQGPDPRRRQDQQPPESGSSVPPSWWGSMWQDGLPGEGAKIGRPRHPLRAVRQLLRKLAIPAVPLAVAGAVVAASFGYVLLAAALAALVVLGIVAATVLYLRQGPTPRGRPSWR